MDDTVWPSCSDGRTSCAAGLWRSLIFFLTTLITCVQADKIPLPRFQDLRAHYPGYSHHGGKYRNHELYNMIGIEKNNDLLLHDTSALRLSYSLNQIGGVHSLGKELIHFSRFGHDSIQGNNQLEYIFLPITFGPYLADKYGYPNITKLHQTNPVQTKHTFWGKQGILRVITYTNHGNQPKGHVALWDCYHFHQSKDWIAQNNLITVEFWESPDSDCSNTSAEIPKPITIIPSAPIKSDQSNSVLHNFDYQSKLKSILLKDSSVTTKSKYLKHLILPSHARHSSRKMKLKNNFLQFGK